MLRKVARQQLLRKQCEAGYRPLAARPIEYEHQIVARPSRTDRPTRWNTQRRRGPGLSQDFLANPRVAERVVHTRLLQLVTKGVS